MQYVNRMSKTFYFYQGSLTTPPCVESVNFIIMQEVQYLTFADIDNFSRFWGGNRRFANGKGNNRAVQPLNGREVFFREETLEQRQAKLTNKFMMPKNEADFAMTLQVGVVFVGVMMMASLSMMIY